MSLIRRAIPFLVALVLVAPGQAATKPKPEPPAAPQGLHGFLLRADEPVTDWFPRTPSFAWERVPGVQKYQFELSTSKRFIESGQVWSGEIARTPAISVPLALPWMTGKPPEYALYARVRTVSTTGKSAWSTPFGFNMQAKSAPCAWGVLNSLTCADQRPSYPGLVQWSAVAGATGYEVWWTDPFINKRISTLATSADEREYYTLREYGALPTVAHWRVRAVRSVYGGLPSGLPTVSYGPWSDEFTSSLTSLGTYAYGAQIEPSATVSTGVNATLDGSVPTSPHTQTPAFLFNGAQHLHFLPFAATELYRVYVFTDRDCLNQVFAGAIVGGPAYSPRVSGPLKLPHSDTELADGINAYLRDGTEGATAMFDQTIVVTTEEKKAVSSSSTPTSEADPPPPPASTPPATTPPSSEQPAAPPFTLPAAKGALVDLWDSGWPTGVYWWTAVRVELVEDYIRDENGQEKLASHYRDTELPQTACAAGRVRAFGKESDPTLTAESVTPPVAAPYVSGLTTDGQLVSATKESPVFYGTPLAAWTPAHGAAAYEVQWSKSAYPWSTEGTVFTFGTSALLQDSSGKSLTPGTWYYRVRGLNPSIVSTIKVMSWSKEVPVVVAKPTFTVLKGATTKTVFRTWPESGFSVALPTSWKPVKANPLAKFYLPKGALDGVATGQSKLRFMAHDPAEKSGTTGVSVLYIPTSTAHGHDTWVKAVKARLAKQKRLVGKPFCVESKVSAGSALKCSYSFTVPNSTLVESEVSYWFDRPGKTYVLALDNLRSANKATASLRLSIAQKFKIAA